MRKLERILLLLGTIFFIAGVSCYAVGFLFEQIGRPYVAEILYPIGSICGPITIVIFIVRLLIMVNSVRKYRVHEVKPQVPKEPKTVDVKEIKKSREEQLFEQYEGLYKQGLISEEDLNQKRKDLLGK